MKIKWGALVVDGRNKIGGHVASKNRAGAYIRTKVTPVNPGSTDQVNVRNRLGGLSSAWRSLNDAQRLTWITSVSDFSSTDIFGDLRNPSGFNLFQMLNNNVLNCGGSIMYTAPLPQAVEAFKSLSIAASIGGADLTLTFADVIAQSHYVLLRATPSLSPGISFVKSEYRQIEKLNYNDSSPYDCISAYTTKFGGLGAEGTRIFIQLMQINLETGQAGLAIQASCIVAA